MLPFASWQCVFQTCGAATAKARLPTVDSLSGGTTRRSALVERSVRRPGRSSSLPFHIVRVTVADTRRNHCRVAVRGSGRTQRPDWSADEVPRAADGRSDHYAGWNLAVRCGQPLCCQELVHRHRVSAIFVSPVKLTIQYDTIRDAILACARKPT